MVGGQQGCHVGHRTPIGIGVLPDVTGTTVLDAIAGIEIGIDTVTGVTAQGLINLLVGIMI